MVSDELIRVAVLWSEMWHELLEEVCLSCFFKSIECNSMNTGLQTVSPKRLRWNARNADSSASEDA
jgi:hypothetical protein